MYACVSVYATATFTLTALSPSHVYSPLDAFILHAHHSDSCFIAWGSYTWLVVYVYNTCMTAWCLCICELYTLFVYSRGITISCAPTSYFYEWLSCSLRKTNSLVFNLLPPIYVYACACILARKRISVVFFFYFHHLLLRVYNCE